MNVHTFDNNILDLARSILQPFPPLSLKKKKRLISNENIFDNLPSELLQKYKPEVETFKDILMGTHPIFQSPRFLSPNNYHPLRQAFYNSSHKIPNHNRKSDVHGNNYLYTKANFRNGVLFTYYDLETKSYIPVTFNTNSPICMVAPDPFYVKGNLAQVIKRMISNFYLLSKQKNLKNFPIIFKGIDINTVTALLNKYDATIIEQDVDVTTIQAEMNLPAISYKIDRLKNMLTTNLYNKDWRKPKVIKTVKKNDEIVYCEEWDFDPQEAKKLTNSWAASKVARFKKHGIMNVNQKYLVNTVLNTLTLRPSGKRNKDYFTLAVRSKDISDFGKLLGVVIASRNNETVAGLNAVVVPVQKSIRDLGYYSVYKLAEKMLQFGILSYWHGPKESERDVSAAIEFLGEPDKIEKKYCIKFEI